MEQDDVLQPKFKIKSYNYFEDAEPRRTLFTIEERGVRGELRKFATEIVQQDAWTTEFSAQDVAKILYVIEQEEELIHTDPE